MSTITVLRADRDPEVRAFARATPASLADDAVTYVTQRAQGMHDLYTGAGVR